jgi:hypothetical protein
LPAAFHLRDHGAAGQERAGDVDAEMLDPFGDVEAFHLAERLRDCRRVDQDVAGAERIERGFEQARCGEGIADVAGNRQHAMPGGLDRRFGRREGILAAGVDHEGGAFSGEQIGGGPAQAAPGAGDDRNLAVEHSHRRLTCRADGRSRESRRRDRHRRASPKFPAPPI